MTSREWNWGQKPEDFPAGLWDEFDAPIDVLEYEGGKYGAQLFLLLMPNDYEWEARDIKPPEEGEDEGLPRGWYGMGGGEDTYRISNDGMEIIGPSPVRTTRAVKLMATIISATGVKLTSTSLVDFQGLEAHWKITMESSRNPETGETRERPMLYAAGKALGHAAITEERSGTGSGRRGRRGRATETTEEDSKEEETKQPSRRRGAPRASQEESTPTEAATQPETKEESNGKNNELLEKAFGVLVDLVEGTKEKGLKRTTLATAVIALDGEIPEEVFEEVAKRGTVNAAIEAGKIVNDEGVLRLPVKEDASE